MSHYYSHYEGSRGISMVELLLIVAVFTILMIAVMTSISSFYRYNGYTIAQSYQVSNARSGIDVLVRDIREMTYADNGAFPLVEMEDHRIGFYSDIDRDDSVEYVEYELATTTIEKRVYNATGSPPVYDFGTVDEQFILSEYVQNLNQSTTTFAYYDEVGNATTTITAVKYIEAKIIVNIDPVRDPGEFMLRSSAAPRNLKENF